MPQSQRSQISKIVVVVVVVVVDDLQESGTLFTKEQLVGLG